MVADVNAETGQDVVQEITDTGARAVFAACDVSDSKQLEATVHTAVEEFGRLDILYNNAGLWFSAQGNYRPGITDDPSPLLEENIWDRTLDVNLKEPIAVVSTPSQRCRRSVRARSSTCRASLPSASAQEPPTPTRRPRVVSWR